MASNTPTPLSIPQALQRALEQHQVGNLSEAEGIYRQVLAAQSDHPGALHGLGMIASQVGKHAIAVEFISRAIAVNEAIPECHNNLGNAYHAQGAYEHALACYQRALTLQPDQADIRRNLVNTLNDLGRYEDAKAYYHADTGTVNSLNTHAAITPQPDHPEQLAQAIAHALHDHRAGKLTEAAARYRQVLALNPDHPDALHLLGTLAYQEGDAQQALPLIDRAIALDNSQAYYYANRGLVRRALGDVPGAQADYRQALVLDPKDAGAHHNLARLLHEQGDYAGAIRHYRWAIEGGINTYSNLGAALRVSRRYDEAIIAVHHAIALAPNDPKSHFELSCNLLAAGQFQEGWREYEWRIHNQRESYERLLRDRSIPASLAHWNGEPLNGRTIVLVAEQGYGDCIQFIRYATLLSRVGARVDMVSPPALVRLFRTVEGIADVCVVRHGEAQFDYHCWLMSLPRLLGTGLESIPGSVPYLKADARVVEYWRERLHKISGLKVGLVWAGGFKKYDSLGPRRDIPLKTLAPLATIPGVLLISLQKGEGSTVGLQAEGTEEMPLLDMTSELGDFADTAALIENLDLVISADTAVAHLAGALGKPVWLLSRYDGCWRWMAPRTDSPWYPTMKIFWQEQPGDWGEVVRRVEQALRALA